MSIWELLFIAVGLSMDAFAVSICEGLSSKKTSLKYAAITGLFFGGFQAIMPLAGFLLGVQFKGYISSIDHWVAFALLSIIGIRMIKESMDTCRVLNESFNLMNMLLLAVATSIDAFAVGVTLAFLDVSIIPAVLIIGCTTFIISFIGVKVGNIFGARFQSKAEVAGGIILIAIGLNILLQHFNIINI
jgi:putative Mn2+ efflux pump MntP